jgi:hypothetical protein
MERGSETRFSVAVEGALQSVTRTGSQITNTRMGLLPNSFIKLSAADAPRRQYPQVGERSRRIRTLSLAVLNAFSKVVKFCASSSARGGWPTGVRCPPVKKNRAPHRSTATTAIIRMRLPVMSLTEPSGSPRYWLKTAERKWRGQQTKQRHRAEVY